MLVNPSGGLEDSSAVADDLAGSAAAVTCGAGGRGGAGGGRQEACPTTARRRTSSTPRSGSTPRAGRPLSIAGLTKGQGRVVLIDFWTYTCINCIRTLPYVKSWDPKYRDDGLTVVGVHSPEFPFEKDAGNVADAIDRYGIQYPVVQDNDLGTWNAFAQPVLAGELPDRRQRRGPLRPLRRGRLRRDRAGDPVAARRGRRRGSRRRREARGPGRDRRPEPTHARDLSRRGPRPAAGSTARSPGSKDYGSSDAGAPAAQPVRLRRRLGDRRRGGDGRRRGQPSRSPSRPAASSWSSAPRTAARRFGCCSTASRSRPPTPATTSTAASRRSPTSASTASSTCRKAGQHTLELRFARGSRATRSRSARACAR